jgi:hypothetical protein
VVDSVWFLTASITWVWREAVQNPCHHAVHGQVDADTSVETLKAILEAESQVPAAQQGLVFGTRLLKDKWVAEGKHALPLMLPVVSLSPRHACHLTCKQLTARVPIAQCTNTYQTLPCMPPAAQ